MKYNLKWVKTVLKNTYLGGINPTEMEYDISTWRKRYYGKETWITVNQLVNKFYAQFLLKIDALPQNILFSLDISTTFFGNLSPDIGEFLITEGLKVTSMLTTNTNH